MTDWSTLNGQRVVSATLMVPYYGTWAADITLAVSTAIPTGTVTFAFADVTLVGTSYRQASADGSRSARVVGGYGGWMKTVAPRAYQNSGGVLATTVLGDVCTDAGEQLGAASRLSLGGQTIGSFFVRESMPAVRALKQIAGQIWWVDTTGATQVVDRATLAASGSSSDTAYLGPITSQFNVIGWSGSKGSFQIASEHPGDWFPGRTFTDPNVTASQTVSLVTHTIDGGGTARISVLATP